MKIRMQIQGFEVKLNGPAEALARVVEACGYSAKIYDTDYEPILFTSLRVVEQDGHLIRDYGGPVVARRVADLEAELEKFAKHREKEGVPLDELES